jgi:hypothetical protein
VIKPQLATIVEFESPETGPQRGAKLGPSQLLRPAQVKAAAAQVHAQQWKLLKATFGKRIVLLLVHETKVASVLLMQLQSGKYVNA